MFVETYPGVFTNGTYGATNRSFAQGEMKTAMDANAALVGATAPSGSDNVFHTALPASPAGDVYGEMDFTDATDVYYLLDVARYTFTVPELIMESEISGTTGKLGFQIDELGHPSILWDGVSVWQDNTITIEDDDEVEVYHFVNGAGGSGFRARINQIDVVTLDTLDSDSGGINSARFGLIDTSTGDLKLSRVAADDSGWVLGGSIIGSGNPPDVTVTPLPSAINTTEMQVTVLASSDAGILTVTAGANGGPAIELQPTATPDQYTGIVTGLLGTAGQTVQNTITVEATDASVDALSTIVELSIAVNLPFGSGGGSGVAFTKTLYLGTGKFAAMNDRYMTLGQQVEGVAPDLDADNTGDVTAALEVSVNGSNSHAVDVAAGWAIVAGDDTDFQGSYADFNAAVMTIVSGDGAPSGGNKRVDIVGAYINDSEHTTRTTPTVDSMGARFAAGSPAAGASLSDKSTWPNLPPTFLPLALALWDSTGIIDILDVRKATGPGIWAVDGQRYRLAVTADGLLGLELVLPWPDWVVIS
jgi:hypothetical protein